MKILSCLKILSDAPANVLANMHPHTNPAASQVFNNARLTKSFHYWA